MGVDPDRSQKVAGLAYKTVHVLEISLLWNHQPACPNARVGPPDSERDLDAARKAIPGQIKAAQEEALANATRTLLDIEWRDRYSKPGWLTRR